jgi:hypothetical protein
MRETRSDAAMVRMAPINPTTAKISKIDWRRVGR